MYLVLFAALHVRFSYLWWFWSVGFDGTHIFGTASRTFFDSEARAKHPRLLFGSVLFFFSLGPLMVMAGWKGWLALLVGVWAYYHVVKQHYGFMILYKVKNGDLARANFAGDYKPKPRVYLAAAEAFDLPPSACMMVAAHTSDLLRAAECGLRTAHVARPNEARAGRGEAAPSQPMDLAVASLPELADVLDG